MAHDYIRSRAVADRQIRKWGGLGALRRTGSADRQCYLVIQDYSPIERVGKMIDPVDRLCLVSALAPDGTLLSPEPSRELDQLLVYVKDSDPPVVDEVWRMSAPPGKLNPGNLVIYFELRVRK